MCKVCHTDSAEIARLEELVAALQKHNTAVINLLETDYKRPVTQRQLIEEEAAARAAVARLEGK